jgi:hypothetical protein
MNKSNTEWHIQEAFLQMLEENQLKEKYVEHKIYTIWGEVIGNHILKHTTKLRLKNKKLYVYINSPIVKNELRMLRSEILEKIHLKIEKKYINDVIIR